MRRNYPFILGMALISIPWSSGNAGGEVPFTPAGIASLKGKDICSLEGEFPKQLGVFLDHKRAHAVQYRERNGVIALFLLSTARSPNCGIVDAVLNLTPLLKKGESVEFKCYTDREGGATWGTWGHIVGLANNQGGRRRIAAARLAWRTNIKKKEFEQIRDKTVQCDTTGYAD